MLFMQYYINLPVSWIHRDKKWLELFIARQMNPELGLDEYSLSLPAGWHKETAEYLRDNGLCCVAHLPFFYASPGARDNKLRHKAVSALQKGAELASVYGAKHLIGHPAFFAETDALPEEMTIMRTGGCAACMPVSALLPADPLPQGWWLENSLDSWKKVLENSDANLFLENTYDLSPISVLSVIEGLRAERQYGGRVGMCFDVGHWFSFAAGSKRNNLEYWLDAISPVLRHMHLHDNRGLSDQHLGLGQGNIPLEELFSGLVARGMKPGVTLEPHDIAALEHSLAWIKTNRAVQRWTSGQAE